ncbi:MAG TPA: protein kinase, partial [Vicinamibacterales bacterium]|nr:protein kinase [Vicinamibacterales bacterium]
MRASPMPLNAGTRLGSYEVVSLVGSGGMGEVYNARDLKLNRTVAIKVLPAAFVLDAERLARFEREAQTLASLNHAHIAQIYGVIEQPPALVMEYVDGEDLAQRLARGPFPMDEALTIARQIADALQAAHDRGIVHRDLKPANIKMTASGAVKVLDFGLAKAMDGADGNATADLANSPTLTSPPFRQSVGAASSEIGVILGTAAYMSPEQARGQPVDRRTDMWAFGCVLFEMLTGQRLFGGASVSDVIAAVLKDAPAFAGLPADTPPPVRRLLRRCLEKDPARRLDSMAAARLEIEDALNRTETTGAEVPAVAVRRVRAAVWGAGLVLVSAAAIASVWLIGGRAPASPPERTLRLTIDSGAGRALNAPLVPGFAFSRNGRTMVFASDPEGTRTGRLFVRRLDEFEAKPLDGTDGATDPFLSPDGRWIGYFARGKLWKISIGGGGAVALADIGEERGGAWGPDDVILYSPDPNPGGRIMKVPAAGGAPTPLGDMPPGHVTQRWPQFLPGGGVIYTTSTTVDDFENACLVAVPSTGVPPKVVQCGGYFWRYVSSGHVLFVHNSTLFAERFDPSTFTITGPPVPVVSNMRGTAVSGAAQFAVADDGTLAYLEQEGEDPLRPVQIVDRQGVSTTLQGVPPGWVSLTFSPDGKRLATYSKSQEQGGIWVYDIDRGSSMRLTRGTITDMAPIWSPDGSRIVFASGRGGPPNLFWVPADGSSGPQRLTTRPTVQIPSSWSPDGRQIAFMQQSKNGFDIWMLPVEMSANGIRAGSATPWLATDANEGMPAFSPDGKYLSYASSETGTPQVYVRPVYGQARYQVSSDGASWSTWSLHSRELLFGTIDGRVMSVTYTIDTTGLHLSRPRPWGTAGYMARGLDAWFALAPDGEHLATSAKTAVRDRDRVRFVTNF